MPTAPTLSIAICTAAFLVWLLAMLSAFSLRRLGEMASKVRKQPLQDKALPPISVVVMAHNQEHELRRGLPLLLEQYYPQFEVIVVDMASTDGTKDLLEKLEEEHPNLRHTFTPPTGRDISQSRLAITLGFKAAQYDWVLLTQADCTPVSHTWIRHIANTQSTHRSAEIVLGYSAYNELPGPNARRMRHYNLWQQMLAMPFALSHGAYRSAGENLLYKRSLFMQHQGFASSATLLTGATDIMVNNHSTRHNTAVCAHPETVLMRPLPKEERMWKQERLFFQETRAHFRSKGLFRFLYALRAGIQWANLLMLIAAAAWGVMLGLTEPLWFIAPAVALLLLVAHFCFQGYCYNYTARTIENRTQNYFLTAFLITFTPFWDMGAWLRRKFTSERQFRKKYI